MIVIKTSANARPITPDGPHSPEGTTAIAAGIDAAFRLLNYATMNGNGGLVYPGDVYSVLGEVAAALNKFPQALRQMSEFIAGQITDGAVRENPNVGEFAGDAWLAHTALDADVAEASALAEKLARTLGEAQVAVRGLEAAE